MKDELKIPNHVAIIVDGNGRWAKEKGLSRSQGHLKGFENIKTICPYIFKKGTKVLSLYVFSTENFKRSKEEVDYLMNLFVTMFEKESKYFKKNNIKVVFSGKDEPLPKKMIEARDEITKLTKNNTGGILNICLNYGGRAEIVDATKKIIASGISQEELTEEVFSHYLYQDLPDIDFLIRTSGELRLSNFLLWQSSYAEFYFPKTYFPDFKEEEYDKALIEYTKRDRRFGAIKDK